MGERKASPIFMEPDRDQDALDAEVVAMQFAGGRSLAQLAVDWERDIAWVEAAVRRALLEQIPQRAGGLKPSRANSRTERELEVAAATGLQGSLDLEL
jgi:hypothetical protein